MGFIKGEGETKVNMAHYMHDAVRGQVRSHNQFIFRENKIYIKSPSEAPKNANIQQGPKGGLYYEPTADAKETPQDIKTTEPETIQDARKFISDYRSFTSNLIDFIKSKFANRSVYGRTKSPESALEKLQRKPDIYRKLSDLKDVSGTRIESDNIEDVYKDADNIKTALTSQRFKIAEEKDYIKNPKDYYKSYHIIAEKDGKFAEIQVRTKNQTKMANFAHDRIYKADVETQKELAKYEEQIHEYLMDLSDYFTAQDMGETAALPDCNQIIYNLVGCYEE